MSKKKQRKTCPCNSDLLYAECCEPYHQKKAIPLTVESLMRSRYSAYAYGIEEYVADTWHETTRPEVLDVSDPSLKWIRLFVRKVWDSEIDNEAFVEFDARYRINGKGGSMQELSRFIYENGRWFYLDGEKLNKDK